MSSELAVSVTDALAGVVGAEHVLSGQRAGEDYRHDEALTVAAVTPGAVVRPADAAEVAGVLRVASAHRVPVTARGSGTGLSGAAVPQPGGLVVCVERMNAILEIDTENHVAVVRPGVTLAQLDEATAARGLTYPVCYDLTQLIIGSEGTLAVVTEPTVRLYPRPPHQATVLAPFSGVDEVARAVPKVVASGVGLAHLGGPTTIQRRRPQRAHTSRRIFTRPPVLTTSVDRRGASAAPPASTRSRHHRRMWRAAPAIGARYARCSSSGAVGWAS